MKEFFTSPVFFFITFQMSVFLSVYGFKYSKKKVKLHAMKVLGGRGSIAPAHS
jgi:hypothetical protein